LNPFLLQAVSIFVMLAVLSILIIVHECGHFSVARFFGFQTPVFGFGLPFGPHWVVGKKWGTEFRIHACLLGGYVAIPELGDESNQDAFGMELKTFRKFPIWQRALVAFAGVGFNILFAYIVMVTMYLTLGQPSQQTGVYSLIKDNPIAMNAGIKLKDEIVSIDDMKVATPEDAVKYLTSHKSTTVHVNILRDKQPLTIDMTTNKDGKVGMGLAPMGQITYTPVTGNFFDTLGLALKRLWDLTYTMITMLGQLVQGILNIGKPSGGQPAITAGDMHGVLAVVYMGSNIVKSDWTQIFMFTVMISMDLAIINLIPWPALDGGHLAFMLFEAIRGRPMGERPQGEIVKWGFISLIVLMVVIMVNDVTALVTGKLDFKKDKEEAKVESKDSKSESKTDKTDTAAPAPAPAN
jgi:membrane-associated protease RseP (regulator of RpoE activity)